MFDRDLLELLRASKINVDEAREIQGRRKARRERYDNQAMLEGMAILDASVSLKRTYKKPALKIANVLKVKKSSSKKEKKPSRIQCNVNLDSLNFD